ncbi:PREDICTED: uncharacterized protein LOC109239016 isoform X1 [Nicotiana attenuata]|uniref:uncharacterized protein LOC109239016 isoform X1 n=1 Tax=Nicotiana attenuata TaxID=49451 RepID=UPI000904603B|nr:PREDICTED: uncharacterized protein LOC109239016 isoform X1 [Nicotiana attenuata]
MNVNIAPSSSINSPATFPVNRQSSVAGIPDPFLLCCQKTKVSVFSSSLNRKIRATKSIVAAGAVEMKEAEKKTSNPVRIVSIVGEDSVSPLNSAPWLDVMLHTSYTGAVLVSPDGQYPAEREKERLVSALDRCGIKEWEPFNVDNCSCEGPPLGLPEGSSLHSKIEVQEDRTHSSV